jgi:hypothetical protein
MGLWRYWLFLTVPIAFAQSSIKIVPGTAVAGGTGYANISITSPSSTSEPSSLEWTLSYPTSVVSAPKVTAGGATTAAGKSLSCTTGTGQVRCIVWGLNTNSIANGILASTSFAVSATAPATSMLGLTGLTAVSGPGKSIATTESAGTLTISPAAKISTLTCTSTSVVSLGKDTCTVTLASKAIEAVTVALGLGTGSAKVTIPASTIVWAGSTTSSFTVTAGQVATNSTAILAASLNGSSRTDTLSLLP